MFNRILKERLLKEAEKYRVVTVTGPRQSGKTTLVRATFPHKPYANLENMDTRDFAISDPRKFLKEFPEGAILDEIQRAPELLSYIQTLVDETPKKGMFILTGSQQVEMHQAVSQSLAGRTALLQLLPLSLQELASLDLPLEEAILKGGYPQIYQEDLDPTASYRYYVQTYLERDLRQLTHVQELSLFKKFIQLCAGRIGQILNVHSLAADVGVSSYTIKQWLSALEASYLIVLLQPYHENFGKRAIKSPKLYFTDVGLATYLLGIETPTQLKRDPLLGSLVENLAFLELLKSRLNRGLDPRLYFFRDSGGFEVDFLFQGGHELIPIEVKGGSTFTSEFLRGVRQFQRRVRDRAPQGALIYTGEFEQQVENIQVISLRNASTLVE